MCCGLCVVSVNILRWKGCWIPSCSQVFWETCIWCAAINTHTLLSVGLSKERIKCFLPQHRNSLSVLSPPSCWGGAVTEQHRGHLGARQGELSAAASWVPEWFWGPSPAARCLCVPSPLQDSPAQPPHRQPLAALCRHCVGQHACSGTEVCPQHNPWHHVLLHTAPTSSPLFHLPLHHSAPWLTF